MHGAMNFFLDITRLATRIFRSGPTGIDRVEFAYAKQMIDDPGTVCVFTAPVFSGAIRAPRARDILQRVERAWRLDADERGGRRLCRGCGGWLDRPLDSGAARAGALPRRRDLGRSACATPISSRCATSCAPSARLARRIARNGEERAMFFHCSHAQLDKPERFRWLRDRRRCASTFFVHDAIPIEFPEFCSPGALDRHVARLATVSAHAIAGDRQFQGFAARRRGGAEGAQACARRRSTIVPLAVDEAFVEARQRRRRSGRKSPISSMSAPSSRARTCCFCWRSGAGWSSATAQRAPRLVIAGRRGWENENIVDVLERSRTARAVSRRGLRSHRRRPGAADGGFGGAGRALVHRRIWAADRRMPGGRRAGDRLRHRRPSRGRRGLRRVRRRHRRPGLGRRRSRR